jgi:hypothetical protein
MSRRLFEDETDSLFSPLIDVVMGALGAFFILLVVYMMLFQQSLSAEPEPLHFLPILELSGQEQIVDPIESLYKLPPAIHGQSYLFTFPVTGGSGKRTFALKGELPDGFNFDIDSGTLYGYLPIDKATGPDSFSFAVSVTDLSAQEKITVTLPAYPVAIPYSPERTPLTLTIQLASLKKGRVKLPYEEVIGVTGGVEPYLWKITEGELPPGLTLDSGYIRGVPEAVGQFNFTIQVSHTSGRYLFNQQSYTWTAETVEHPYQIEILEPLEHAVTFPVGRVQEPFIGGVTTSGLRHDEYVVWSGSIPGIQISADETVLFGIPTESGVYALAYEIRHQSTVIGEGQSDVTILAKRPDPQIGPATFQAWIGETARLTIPYRGLVEPIQPISLVSGELPEGLKFVDDLIIGTPNQTGLFTITILVTDSIGKKYEGEITIRIGERF